MNSFQRVVKIGAVCLGVFIIIVIINCMLMVASVITGVGFNRGSRKDFNEVYTNIEKIDVDVSSLKLFIREGDELKVDATDVRNSFKVKQNNKTLKISEEGSWFFDFGNNGGSIVITVPRNVIDELKVDAGAGTIEIDSVDLRVLDLDQGAGSLTIKNSIILKTDLDGGTGEIIVDNSELNDLDLDSGVGSVKIDGKILGKSEIDCGVGEVILNLDGDENDYYITVDKGLGSISLNGVDYSSNATLGNGNNRIKVEGGVGSIDINLNKQSYR